MTKFKFAAILVFLCAMASPAWAKTIEVNIKDLDFAPKTISVAAGDTVEWTNQDIFVHSVTARDKSFDINIPAGAKQSYTFKTPGSFEFYCRYHPNMKGKIDVSDGK